MTSHAGPTAGTVMGTGVAVEARNSLRPQLPRAEDFVSRVIAVVQSIPSGKVMAYGDIAAAVGSRAARGVGQVMAYYGSDLPWWRVIRANGQPPQCHDAQALPHYEEEGTPLVPTASGYRIDLRLARHRP